MNRKKISLSLLISIGLNVRNVCYSVDQKLQKSNKILNHSMVNNVGLVTGGLLTGIFGTLLYKKKSTKDKNEVKAVKSGSNDNAKESDIKLTDEVLCRCIFDFENNNCEWDVFSDSLVCLIKKSNKKEEDFKSLIEYELKCIEDSMKSNLNFKKSDNGVTNETKTINVSYKYLIKLLRECSEKSIYGSAPTLPKALARKGVFEIRKMSDSSYFLWYAVKDMAGHFLFRDTHELVGDTRALKDLIKGFSFYEPDDDYGLENKKIGVRVTEEYFDKVVRSLSSNLKKKLATEGNPQKKAVECVVKRCLVCLKKYNPRNVASNEDKFLSNFGCYSQGKNFEEVCKFLEEKVISHIEDFENSLYNNENSVTSCFNGFGGSMKFSYEEDGKKLEITFSVTGSLKEEPVKLMLFIGNDKFYFDIDLDQFECNNN